VKPRRRSFQLLAILFLFALIGSACSDDKKTTDKVGASSGSSESSAAPKSSGKFERLPGTPGGSATFAYDQEYTGFNNATASNGLAANTIPLQLVQPQPFITDGGLQQLLNTELMDSVEVTSSDPQVVEWKIKQNASWQDSEPIDCSDFYLAWLAQSGTAEYVGDRQRRAAQAAVRRALDHRLRRHPKRRLLA